MNRIASLVLSAFIGAALIAAGCGNGSLLAPNGSSSDEIGTLSLSAIHHLNDDTALEADADGFKTFTNDRGFSITVEESHIGWKSVTLISGGEDPECEAGHDQNITIGKQEDLLAEDLVASDLVDAMIPMISYCNYRIHLGPSDAAALVVDGSKNHAGVDHGSGGTSISDGAEATLHISGTWAKGAASGSFHIESTETLIIDGAFQSEEAGEIIEHPFHFHEGETSVALTFGTHYDEILEGIDFQTDSVGMQSDKSIGNLTAAVHQHGISHDN